MPHLIDGDKARAGHASRRHLASAQEELERGRRESSRSADGEIELLRRPREVVHASRLRDPEKQRVLAAAVAGKARNLNGSPRMSQDSADFFHLL